MNLAEKLLQADANKAKEKKKCTYRSCKLGHILGVKSVEIEITELSGRRISEIIGTSVNRNGEVDFTKSYDANLMMCVEGITSPSLRDKDLQAHFGVHNAKDLCEALFDTEVNEIAEAISTLSSLGDRKENEEEIKNS